MKTTTGAAAPVVNDDNAEVRPASWTPTSVVPMELGEKVGAQLTEQILKRENTERLILVFV
ncbi:MAG TPA: hypothetical protein DD827_03145 [Gammaproteobacteria bacterium]|jgi:hypothetical protein|nr:hypothetical protein [Gammaproteobacteria bacterium]